MTPTPAPRTYQNPVWSGPLADPFVLKVRGRYYAYGTEGEERPPDGAHVFPILTSPDLVQWRECGKALPALGAPFFRYWAPEVAVDNDRFLLYYAVHTAAFTAAIRVAVAERPDGPFVDSGHDLTGALFPWAIDPHPFRDADGQWYLYMTVELWDDPAGLIGVGNVVDRMLDPLTLSGHPTRVTPPRHAWELFEARRPEKGGVDWYCVEGPAVLRHRDRYYELFSGGCYYRDNYAVSYAISEAPMGPDGMRDDSWQDWEPKGRPGWLMHGDPAHALSPGHNSLVMGPNNADLYIAYHAWPPDMTERRPCLDRLYWHGATPWTPAPTHEPQPAPAMPRLRTLVDPDQAGLSASWQADGGTWRVARGAVERVQPDGRAVLWQAEPAGPTWALEVHLRHLGGDGRYGLVVERNGGGSVTIAVDPRTDTLVVPDESGTTTVPLPASARLTAWRQLLLTYAGALLTVALDGLPLATTMCGGLTGRFGLYAEGCAAAFSAVSLTDCFRDEFLDPAATPALLGWRAGLQASGAALPDAWRIEGGALLQSEAAAGERRAYKGAAQHAYELGATMRLVGRAAGLPAAYGLIMASPAAGALRVCFEEGADGWSAQVAGSGWEAGVHEEVRLGADFDPQSWHALRLVRSGAAISVYVDGPLALTVAVPAAPTVVGLTTANAAAAFTGVWQTVQR